MDGTRRQLHIKANGLFGRSFILVLGGLLCLGLTLAPLIGAQSGTLETDLEFGAIDWETGIVRAKGLGVPPDSVDNPTQRRAMAKRAARIVAYQRLLEITQGIKINSRTLVKNLMIENEEIAAEVKGIVKGAQVVNEQPFTDGSFEVTVEMNLNQVEGSIPNGPKIRKPEFAPTTSKPAPQNMNYTGLVINAQGLKVRECLAPKIKMEDGQVVYARDLWPDANVGVVGYVKGLTTAEMHEKVKSNPLIVKALRIDAESETDFVINQADAQSIYLEPENEKFLQQGKVVIAY